MIMNDPIADMLTRIRNALIARHDTVTLPASNMKKAIAKILLDEGYVKSIDSSTTTCRARSRSCSSMCRASSRDQGPQAHLQAGPSRVCPP